MARTSEDAVRGVIQTEAPSSTVQSFISDAGLEVNERVNAADAGYSDERMAKIEKYLAAHLVRFLWDRQENTTTVANVTTEYSGAFGEGLTATAPGQVVLDTDTADVFSSELNPDENSELSGVYATRSRYVATAERSGGSRVEGTEEVDG